MHVTRSFRFLCLAAPFLALVAATPRQADACSCAPESPFLSPVDGAIGVPRNAIVAVLVYSGTLPEQLAITEAATGAAVAADVEVIDHVAGYVTRLLIARPREPLAAATEYRISISEGGWEPGTFVTGDALDQDAPVFAGLSALQADTTAYDSGGGCVSSCVEPRDERVQAIELSFPDPGSDVAFMTLALRREGDAEPLTVAPIRRLPAGFVRTLGFHSCDSVLAPALEPGQVYCGQLTAYDAAGNISASGAEVCSAASECAQRLEDESCWPNTSCNGSGPVGCSAEADRRDGWPGALLAAMASLLVLGRLGRRARTRA